ncbi:hypothetical protein [Novosphingobium sp. Chol11]|uniref:hypothetical protein n=1 Tax=Novosphingobium sp. Chol11 TaxID=1385763 RepID=UPI000BE309CE|nr:hypothetical protein [Novosphingobium sp. Chol11]
MAARFKNLAVPMTAAIAAWFAVPVDFWSDARSSLLTAFSVIAAAVMVRLARGLPFTNADHFEVEEIRQVATAIKQIMRSLQALIGFILATMIAITFADRVHDLFAQYGLPTTRYIADHALSAALGFCLAFVLVRIIQVVRGDYSLVELQSKFMIRAVERKEAKKYDEARASSAKIEPPYRAPEGFGRLIQ